MNTTTTPPSGTITYTPTAAMPASTTSASAFNAARRQGQFGRYGFDGVSQPLASTPSMQSPAKPSSVRGWIAKLYPSDFMPKSLAGRMLLAPLGLLMLAGAALKTMQDDDESGPANSPGLEDDTFEGHGIGLSVTEDVYRDQ